MEKLFGVSFREEFSVLNESSFFSLYEHFEKKVSENSLEPFCFVDRKIYDQELVSFAQKKGCQFLFGDPVVYLDIQKNWMKTKSGKHFQAQVLIGADGINSRIRRKIYTQRRFRSNLDLAFLVFLDPQRVRTPYRSFVPQLFLGNVRWGYSWIFPHGKELGVGTWGLIRKNPNLGKIHLHFLKKVTIQEEKNP